MLVKQDRPEDDKIILCKKVESKPVLIDNRVWENEKYNAGVILTAVELNVAQN